ncbi:hypothetical protein [Candidatus Cardinium hertigii]
MQWQGKSGTCQTWRLLAS